MSRAISLAVAFGLLLVPAVASAHDEPGPQKADNKALSEAAREGAEGAEKEEPEPPWEFSADVVGGATTTDAITAGRPARIELPPLNVFDSTRVSAYTFLFGIERHLGERFAVGARMPFIAADLSSRTGVIEDRSVALAGNLELEGSFVIARGRNWNLVAALGVALPTGGGKEPPTAAEVAADPAKRFEYRRHDLFAAAHAASATLGSYDSALFEPGNLGIVPQISANFHFSELTITPTLKVENLIDVTGDANETYINEIVGGVRAGFRVTRAFEPGVHVWFRDLHEQTHSDSSSSAVGVVEPYLRFHLGAFRPAVSVILPFAGDLADSKTFGVRAGFVAEF